MCIKPVLNLLCWICLYTEKQWWCTDKSPTFTLIYGCLLYIVKGNRISHTGRTTICGSITGHCTCTADTCTPGKQFMKNCSWSTVKEISVVSEQAEFVLSNVRVAITEKETLICSQEFSQNYFSSFSDIILQNKLFYAYGRTILLFILWCVNALVINELSLLSYYSRLLCIPWRKNAGCKRHICKCCWQNRRCSFFRWRICFHLAYKREEKKKKACTSHCYTVTTKKEKHEIPFSIYNKVPAWYDIIRLSS